MRIDDGLPKRHRESSEEGDSKRVKATGAHSDGEMDQVVKTEVDDGERLLIKEPWPVNGALDAKEGVLDEEGHVKILNDYTV